MAQLARRLDVTIYSVALRRPGRAVSLPGFEAEDVRDNALDWLARETEDCL